MLVTERNYDAVMQRIEKQDRIDMDTETNGLHVWHGARQIGVSIGLPNKNGIRRSDCFYFPFRHRPGGNLGPQRQRQLMAVLSRKILTCWNGKFDAHMTMADGAEIADTSVENVDLLFHLLDENQHKTGGSYELKTFADRYIDPNAKLAQLRLTERLADLGLGKGDMQELTPEEVEDYASDDVYYTEKGRELLVVGAVDWELDDLWTEVNEYSMVTRRMEARGFMIDRRLTRELIDLCETNKAKLKRKIDRMAGHELNLRSPKQMQAWLELPSTAQDYIDEIEWRLSGRQKTAVATLQEYRKWDRAQGSYYEPFLANIDREGAYHPNIKLHGTISGRPSSTGTPNPFAIPRTTEIYRVKDTVVSRPGYTLISADYAQMELRFAAHYAQDEYFIQCFNEGKSPHKLMLQLMLEQGVEVDYDGIKRVNFGIQYGTGAPTLSKELGKPEAFAKQVLKAAHALHPNYRPMLKQTEDVARAEGFIRLWTGRVRHFDTLPNPQPWYHKACSNLIQGGVGEVMRHAITRLGRHIVETGMDWHMLLQVYDQILFEVPDREVKHALPVINSLMTEDFPFTVPFVVDIKVGKRWGTLKEVKVP